MALEVRRPDGLPADYVASATQLASAYIMLEDWHNAVSLLTDVLRTDKESQKVRGALSYLYHDTLFDFEAAYKLNRNWFDKHQSDLDVGLSVVEDLFSISRYEECRQQASALAANQNITPKLRMIARAYQIASSIATADRVSALGSLQYLFDEVKKQPSEFEVGWDFVGTFEFINKAPELKERQSCLRSLFKGLEASNREAILVALNETMVICKQP
jgi:hypothetical protein